MPFGPVGCSFTRMVARVRTYGNVRVLVSDEGRGGAQFAISSERIVRIPQHRFAKQMHPQRYLPP